MDPLRQFDVKRFVGTKKQVVVNFKGRQIPRRYICSLYGEIPRVCFIMSFYQQPEPFIKLYSVLAARLAASNALCQKQLELVNRKSAVFHHAINHPA